MQSKVTVDIKKNRVILNYRGKISKKVASSMYTDARFCAADLKPGFDIISDFSECELAHVSAISTMRTMILYLIEKGAGEAIRILGETNIVNKQIINLATWIPGHKPVYAGSIEEAEEKLLKMIRREGMRIHFHEFPVYYLIDDERLKGNINNISISGCAILTKEKCPPEDSTVPLLFIFHKDDQTKEELELSGKVVRVDQTGFAVTYADEDEVAKKNLFSNILKESHRALEQVTG